MEITTDTGTTVRLEDVHGHRSVICDNPNAPDEFRHREVGRVIEGGFQAAPFSTFGMRPGVLRAIATLIESEA